MSNEAVAELNSFWIDFFSSQNPNKIGSYIDGFGNIPLNIKEKFQLDFYPEPFYGYFHEDMTNDILVPLINPGQISVESLKQFFPSSSDERTIALSNNHIKERHLTWNKEDYVRREKEFIRIQGEKNWRNIKFKQCKKLIGDDIGFMHTIEFFPYHSASWNVTKELQENWIYNLESTKLAINAIEEISKKHLVKHIIGIGKVWASILDFYEDMFYLESYQELYGPNGGRAHNIYKYKPLNSPSSLPIVIYSGSSMHLPTKDEKAVNLIRSYLELV